MTSHHIFIQVTEQTMNKLSFRCLYGQEPDKIEIKSDKNNFTFRLNNLLEGGGGVGKVGSDHQRRNGGQASSGGPNKISKGEDGENDVDF